MRPHVAGTRRVWFGQLGPNGAGGCSHGWSAAEPVDHAWNHKSAPDGAEERITAGPSIEQISFIELDSVDAE